MRLRTIALFLVLGIACLPLGAGLLVNAAVEMAMIFGVSDSAIGLTIVAIGTSLPELATTTMAAVRRNADVALGNVIGSNLFNLLLIAGGAALFGTIPVPGEFLVFDLWCMLGASVLLAPFVFFRKLSVCTQTDGGVFRLFDGRCATGCVADLRLVICRSVIAAAAIRSSPCSCRTGGA